MIMYVTETTGITALLGQGTLVFTEVTSMITALCTVVMANPLLLIGVILMMIGFVVGICKRLISTF